MQVFLYKASDVPGTDKAKLQQQILETIFSKGARLWRTRHAAAPWALRRRRHLCWARSVPGAGGAWLA